MFGLKNKPSGNPALAMDRDGFSKYFSNIYPDDKRFAYLGRRMLGRRSEALP
jgi:hypothetical protein